MQKINFKSKKTIGIIAISLVVLIAVIWFVAARKKKSETPAIEIDESEITASLFPLTKGSKNDYVTVLQQWLVNNGGSLPNYGVDGEFGSETENAVKAVLGVDSVSLELFKSKIL